MAVLFLVRYPEVLNGIRNLELASPQDGLKYSNVQIGDLVNVDTDLDGVTDWEESLWGTDPTKPDTNDDGTSDFVEIEKLKAAEGKIGATVKPENLTETDKFSREFFSTVASLNQAGAVDDVSVEKISESLSESIQNSVQKKIYFISDIKTTEDNSPASMHAYDSKMGALLFDKYPMNEKIVNVFKESLMEDGEINAEALIKLDPVIRDLENITSEMLSISVPSKVSSFHLILLNAFQSVAENLNDIKLVDADPVLAMGAINNYLKNNDRVDMSLVRLGAEVAKNKN